MQRGRHPAWAMIPVLAAAGGSLQAGTDLWGDRQNRVGFNVRAAFNIEASFDKLGGIPAGTDIGPATGRSQHYYDDGYNLVGSDGNAGGVTYNWGYDRLGQIEGDRIGMSSTTALDTGSLDGVGNDQPWGGELLYMRELGWNGAYWYGLVVGLSWQDLQFEDDTVFTTSGVRTTDYYTVPAGTTLPVPPYYGGFNSVTGPRIGDVPDRVQTPLANAGATSGHYELDGAAYLMRVGLLFETPFTDRFDLQFGGGFVGAFVQTTFQIDERSTLSGVGGDPTRVSGSSTDGDFVGGAYAEVDFSLRVADGLYAVAGAQYMFLTDYDQTVLGREATIDFGQTILATLGMTFAF